MRKRDNRSKQLVSTLDDFHGSSNITKICTQAIVLERANGINAPKWYQSPTFIAVLKDRRSGVTGLVAVNMYDRRKKAYGNHYAIGKINGAEWQETLYDDRPAWAKSCHHMEKL